MASLLTRCSIPYRWWPRKPKPRRRDVRYDIPAPGLNFTSHHKVLQVRGQLPGNHVDLGSGFQQRVNFSRGHFTAAHHQTGPALHIHIKGQVSHIGANITTATRLATFFRYGMVSQEGSVSTISPNAFRTIPWYSCRFVINIDTVFCNSIFGRARKNEAGLSDHPRRMGV